MSMLEIKDLNVFYGEFQALNGIELEVQKSRIVSLMGANSAGKSTLLKTISGILKPATGSITFDNKRIDGLDSHDIIAMGMALVPQGRKIFSNLTVRENLHLDEAVETVLLHPAADPADVDAAFAHQPAVVEQVFRGCAPVADVESEDPPRPFGGTF